MTAPDWIFAFFVLIIGIEVLLMLARKVGDAYYGYRYRREYLDALIEFDNEED